VTGTETLNSASLDELQDEIVELELIEECEDFEPDALYHVVLLSICAAVIILSMLLTVRGEQFVVIPFVNATLPEMCSFKRVVGLDCPGCGLTRCFISLGHGDVPSALHFSPVGVIFFAVVLIQVPYRLIQIMRLWQGHPELRLASLGFWLLALVAVGLIGQWIVKTIVFLVQS
jgi:hypothetical protein